jgi:MFS family permease
MSEDAQFPAGPATGIGGAAPAETEPVRAGPPDEGPPDEGPPGAGPPGAGPPDEGPPGAGPAETGPAETGPAEVEGGKVGRPGRDRLGSAFGRLWAAAAVSAIGDGMALTAAPLLAATLTRDPLSISLVSATGFLPWLLVGLLSGALVDRWDRRRTMWTVDLGRAAVVAALAVAVLAGAASIPLLLVAIFLLGTGQTLFDGAAQAAIPAVVSRDPARLHRANGRLLGTQTVGQSFLGPPAGGVLFTLAGWLPFAADGLSFLASSALVGSLRGQFAPDDADGARPARRSMRAEIGEGVRWLVRHRLLRTLALVACMVNIAGAASYSLLVLLAQDRLGLGNLGFGLLLTAEAVGALLGSLLAGRVSRLVGTTRAIAIAMLLEAAGTVVLGLTRLVAVAAVTLAISSLAIGVWNVLGQSLRQELTPGRLMGRVVTAFRMVGLGGIPIGGLAGGLLARQYGLSAAFLFAAALTAVTALAALPILTERSLAAARAAESG